KKMPQKQAVAVALSVARRKGLKVGKSEAFDREPLRLVGEDSPPGWHGTVRAMKTHHHTGQGEGKIDNPYALAWWMKNRGEEAHYQDQETSKRGAPHKKEAFKDEPDSFDGFGPEDGRQQERESRQRRMAQKRTLQVRRSEPESRMVYQGSHASKKMPGTSPIPRQVARAGAEHNPNYPHNESEGAVSIFDDLIESRLTTSGRKHIKKGNFALPSERSKTHGKGGYPIHDLKHARNALSRVSTFGSPEEKSKVRAKVYAKYPGLKKRHDERESKDESLSVFDGLIQERELPEAFKQNIGRFKLGGKKEPEAGESSEHEAGESAAEERAEKDCSESMFDSFVQESTSVDSNWENRVARTYALAEELSDIRDAACA
ncbi:MAG: hypothetical protein AB7V39_27790, partial [Nitrospiraceae bacterium]